jgi:head-tail adaptor
MQAGKLRGRISIQQNVPTQDTTYGTDVDNWVSIAWLPGSPSVAARINAEVYDLPPGKSEAVRMSLETARSQTRFRIRYRAGVVSSMRIVLHGGTDRIFNIVGGPAIIGNKEWLEMVGEEYSS